ncbi:MAG: class I SAM-dependent methyltransferase [Verrucomicrobiales bacterium]|nr:class I SAM-dependent methyltransferase [Verrucomicrobiales bacterium]
MTTPAASTYAYRSTDGAHTDAYLWTTVERILAESIASDRRVFDLGCGNGTLARHLGKLGYEVYGVDPSEEGISQARIADPETRLRIGSAYDPLSETYGMFPAVISLEVVEHVYSPRLYARCVYDLLEPGGVAIISTPYHGYLKNLALSLLGKWDWHFTALWDHGHIKFWSIATLTSLFQEQGMTLERVHRVGRIPALAKSMILTFRKPERVLP